MKCWCGLGHVEVWFILSDLDSNKLITGESGIVVMPTSPMMNFGAKAWYGVQGWKHFFADDAFYTS